MLRSTKLLHGYSATPKHHENATTYVGKGIAFSDKSRYDEIGADCSVRFPAAAQCDLLAAHTRGWV